MPAPRIRTATTNSSTSPNCASAAPSRTHRSSASTPRKRNSSARSAIPAPNGTAAPELVNDHDFPSDAEGRAIPYGIYDPRANAGTVFVGQTADTPAFAVDCIEKWWRTEGRKQYPDAQALQILADGGGSNSCTARAWKFNLQHRLCNRHALRVTVAHYPPATSKWNPIEHRLFCEISKKLGGPPSGQLRDHSEIPAHHTAPPPDCACGHTW